MKSKIDLKELKKDILNDPILSHLSKLSNEKNIPIFLVGGYIRDRILGIDRKDYDLTIPKDFRSFISMIEENLNLHFFKVGKEEETITFRIIKEDISIDLSFLQGETIEEDLKRRDFTINAIAFSLIEGSFHWVEGALRDIGERIIRPVSLDSIDKDPLRMLRAIRYLSTLDDFNMDKGLKEDISLKKEMIKNIPGERIKMELDHILLSSKPGLGIKILYETNLLFTIFPELKNLEGLGQDEHHHLDVFSHTLLMIEKILWAFDWIKRKKRNINLNQEDWLSLYYSSLFHDIGKQHTFSKDEKGRVHFYHHEFYSSQEAGRIMERLRFSNALKNRILRLIENHMRILNLLKETKEKALKRLVNQMGEETPLLVILSLADKEASRGLLSVQRDEVVEAHCLHILKLFEEKEVLHPPPLITGHDVIALGYPPGPKVGQILNFIREKQIDGEIKTREEALETLRSVFKLDRRT